MLLSIGLLSSLIAVSSNRESYLPENDLWMYDNIQEMQVGKSEATFRKIASDLQKAYASEASKNKETLVVNALWSDSTVNADCERYNGKVTINLYGGLYRRSEVNSQAFALVASHEASHAYAGAPYYPGETLSAEGNSDHFAAKVGYWKLAPLFPAELITNVVPSSFINNACTKAFGIYADNRFSICLNLLVGGEHLAQLLSVLSGEATPDYETPDKLVVKKTNTSYPSTQCRLDSTLKGALNSARALCWYKP